MTKLIGPLAISSISIAGILYTVAAGVVDVDPSHVAEALPFGFTVATDEDAEDDPSSVPGDVGSLIDTMSRQQMFAYLKDAGVAAAVPITNDKLREICRQVEADAKAKANAAPAPAPTPDPAPTPAPAADPVTPPAA